MKVVTCMIRPNRLLVNEFRLDIWEKLEWKCYGNFKIHLMGLGFFPI